MAFRLALMFPACVLICCSLANGQDDPTQADLAKPVYMQVQYIQVPDGGDELYLKVENVWTKIHKARRDLGLITAWATCRVERSLGSDADYNYVVVHLCDSWEDLENPIPWAKIQEMVSFSEEENSILEQTGESRDLLRSEIWRFDSAAIPERFGKPGFDRTLTVGFMKSKRPRAHRQLEREVYSKLWAQAAQDGYRWNWSLWGCRFPSGSQRPHDLMTVHTYPEGKANYQVPAVWRREAMQKAFPDDTAEDLRSRFGRAGALRDMVAVENWTIVAALAE
jgi:hypothetical protein